MPAVRPLRHAPIIEALLDVRFDVSDSTSVEQLRPLVAAVKETLPWLTETGPNYYQADLFGESALPIQQANLTLHNSETLIASSRVIVVYRDGFTVKQIGDYSNWQEMEVDFLRTLDVFVRCTSPAAIIRLGTRFVNKIDLPEHPFELEDIFTCGPKIPSDAPQTLFHFHQRIGVEADPAGLFAWIDHYLRTEPRPNAILDIDCFWDQRFGPTWQAIEVAIDAIHTLKNKLFFGALTDSALRSYE